MGDMATFEELDGLLAEALQCLTASLSQPNRRGNEGRHGAPAGEEGARGE